MENTVLNIWKGLKLFCVALLISAVLAGMIANATREIFTKEIQIRIDGLERHLNQLEMVKEQNEELIAHNAVLTEQNKVSIHDRALIHEKLGRIQEIQERIEKAVSK